MVPTFFIRPRGYILLSEQGSFRFFMDVTSFLFNILEKETLL